MRETCQPAQGNRVGIILCFPTVEARDENLNAKILSIYISILFFINYIN